MAKKVVKPPKPHVRTRICDECGFKFPEEELTIWRSESGTIIGYFCERCLTWL